MVCPTVIDAVIVYTLPRAARDLWDCGAAFCARAAAVVRSLWQSISTAKSFTVRGCGATPRICATFEDAFWSLRPAQQVNTRGGIGASMCRYASLLVISGTATSRCTSALYTPLRARTPVTR